ncbi:MAG: hypothetical protein ACREIR_13495 [Geminicoccaceae bacterium]
MNRGCLRSAHGRTHTAAMGRKYWTKAFPAGRLDLEAATKRSDVNAAAKQQMRAKAVSA